MFKHPIVFTFFLLLHYGSPAQYLYISDIQGNFFRLNIENCQKEHICSFGVSLYDITYYPDGTLYGITRDGSLYELDSSTCDARLVFHFDTPQNYNSLSADGQGNIFVTGENGVICWFNPATGNSGMLGVMPFAASGDLTFNNGKMYVACIGDRIVEINTTNPSKSQVFMQADLPAIVIGIAGYSEQCSAVRTFVFTPSEVYEVDFSNKTMHLMCSNNSNISGAASPFEFNGSYGLQISASDATCTDPNGLIVAGAVGSIGGVLYNLNGGPFQEENTFAGLRAGWYIVQSLDSLGCLLTDSVFVGASDCPFYLPNAINPESNSGNEAFTVFGAAQLVQTVKAARIYDRWGGLVFDCSEGRMIINDLNSGWDGTCNGRPMPQGVYIYRVEIEMIDGKTIFFEGDVTLLRN